MLHDFRVRQRDFLLEITRAITGQLDLNEVLRLVLNASVVMLSGEVGLIALRDLNGAYRVRATMGVQNEHIDQLNAQLEDLVADTEDGLDYKLINEKMRQMAVSLHPSLRQSIALPLVMAGEPLGLLIVFRSYRGNATPDDIQILQSFADQASIAVKNAQLYAGINQERRRLSAILQNSADGVMILDPHLRVLSFNRALERMTGWQESETMGLHVSSVIRWQGNVDDLETFIEQGWPYKQIDQNDETTADTNNLYVEGDIIRQDDLPISIAITYAPLVTRSGQLTNIIASVRDITNFRKAQQMQNMFVSTVSHELRTPITLIKGYAETLSR
ncbi:MAG: PAS domain S-box protein, partial [Chloroflexota bacterium]